MQPFHKMIPAAIRRRGMTLRAASLKINKSAPYLSTICRKGMDPSLGTLIDLSRLLNISIDDLASGRDPEFADEESIFTNMHHQAETFAAYARKHARDALAFRADEPDLEVFMAWFMSTDGDMDKLAWLEDFVDIYEVPNADAQRPNLHKMGAKSLAARTISDPSTERLRHLLGLTPRYIARLIVVGQTDAAKTGMRCSVEQIDFPIDNGDRVSLRYFRTFFLARSRGMKYIINYSKVIV